MDTSPQIQIQPVPYWLVKGTSYWYWDMLAQEPVNEIWEDTTDQRYHYLHLGGYVFQTEQDARHHEAMLQKLYPDIFYSQIKDDPPQGDIRKRLDAHRLLNSSSNPPDWS